MKTLFQYSLLQYHHSALIGEVMNVCIGDFSRATSNILHSPRTSYKAKGGLSQCPENVLRSYFKGMKERTNQLNKQPELFNDYQSHPKHLLVMKF
jgi:hypothetical protein